MLKEERDLASRTVLYISIDTNQKSQNQVCDTEQLDVWGKCVMNYSCCLTKTEGYKLALLFRYIILIALAVSVIQFQTPEHFWLNNYIWDKSFIYSTCRYIACNNQIKQIDNKAIPVS